MNRYEEVKKMILEKQRVNFSTDLYYHGIHHIMDVLNAAVNLGEAENISGEEMELLKLAVLFHDAGYMYGNTAHEAKSCSLVQEILPGYGYTNDEINLICNLIMATQTPQRPITHLEKIICDADMDYLGRDDYESISETLRKELAASNREMTHETWLQMQLDFLSQHHYFTNTAIKNREPKKQFHIEQIRKEIPNVQ